MIDMMDLYVPKRDFFQFYIRVGKLLSYLSYKNGSKILRLGGR